MSESSRDSIAETARKAADLALGAADYALEAARKLTDQFTGRGGQRRHEVTRHLNRLAERGRRLRLATRADLEQLEARIAALEKAARKES